MHSIPFHSSFKVRTLTKEKDVQQQKVQQQKIKPDLANPSQHHGHILMEGAIEGSPHQFLLLIYLLSTQLACSIGPQLSISETKSNEQPVTTSIMVPCKKSSEKNKFKLNVNPPSTWLHEDNWLTYSITTNYNEPIQEGSNADNGMCICKTNHKQNGNLNKCKS